jgi:uncharacterized protein (TIGR02996 family)
MTHDEAFLRAIIADPDDDGPRLVYADWLEERGDPQGEFIRVQLALASLPEGDPRRWELEAREGSLLKDHESEWVGPLGRPLAGMLSGWAFRRGFIEELTVEARGLLPHADTVFRLAPIRHLQVYLARSRISQLANLPQLARLSTLGLDRNSLGDEGVGALASSPHLSQLAHLALRWNHVGDAGVEALAASACLPRLATLTLIGNEIGDRGALALARSASLSRLTALELYHNPLGQRGREALWNRFGGRVRL